MKLDSDYAVRLAILGALGGDTTKSYDSVYEVDLAILAATQSGSGVDLETVDVLPNAAENKDKILRLSTDNQIYFAVDNSGTWEWQALVVSETQVINDNVTSSETTWSSNKINSELSSIIGDANSEIVASETVDVTFVNAVPTGEGAEGEYKVYVTEQADTLYMYENGSWTVQTIDANKLYFDTENDLLYTYKTATQKFVEVGLDNTIIFSGSITGTAAKTALNPIKTPGVYNVLQHQTTSGKTKMTNWAMTVTYLDSDEADEVDGSVYQKLENNYTIYKRYYKPTTDTWTSMVKYYEGLVRDSLTSSAYYCWSINKVKSEIEAQTYETATNADVDAIFNKMKHNEIWYTSSDGNIVTPYQTSSLPTIVSNTYSDGKGIIKFANDITSIGTRAFQSCTRLTSIEIPNSLTSIGIYAFSGCSGLTSVTIPNSVTSIGDNAFRNCSGLTSVEIPNSVTSIGEGAFSGCSGLTSVTIPDNITSITERTFYECQNLTSVTIPDSVTSIGRDAFYRCSSLTSVTIPNSVTSIGNAAFHSCSGLTSVNIPNNVTSIGNDAFSGCRSLTSVRIPNNVTSIGRSAFSSCSNLASVIVENGNIVYDSRNDCNAIIETATNTIIQGCQNTTIPNSVTSIGIYAFYGCSELTSIVIPNSVTNIGSYAFGDCSGLTSVTIPDSVTSIGDYVFNDCANLTSVTISNGVTSIGLGMFWNCGGLISITIPNSVTSIGNNAFKYCNGLTSITIPNSVTSIGSDAFGDCTSLTSVTIGNSVTSIGSMAFYDCTNLTSISYNGTVSEWNAITKGNGWHGYVPATAVHCTDGDVNI